MSLEHGYLLVVSADQANRNLLNDQLERVGYTVIIADDGQQALALLQTEAIDLLLLTLDVPGMGGLETLQALKNDVALRTIPVLILTGAPGTPHLAACLDLGAEDYVLVPDDLALLRRRVRTSLAEQRLHKRDRLGREQASLEKTERDLEIGQQIQRGFLPTAMPTLPGWEVASYYNPAREVGGDLFDVFELTPGGAIALIIGDVCDKGVGAAIFMALFRSFLRAAGRQRYPLGWTAVEKSPASADPDGPDGQDTFLAVATKTLTSAVALTNDYVLDNHGDAAYFLTVFFGVLEPGTGRLAYINGGHLPPLIIGPEGVKASLEPTGPAVGIFPAVTYSVREAQIALGDLFFSYTDGVTDARDEDRRFFGAERLTTLVSQPPGAATALVQSVDASLSAHIGQADQYDDITMLAVRRVPPPANSVDGVTILATQQPEDPEGMTVLGVR